LEIIISSIYDITFPEYPAPYGVAPHILKTIALMCCLGLRSNSDAHCHAIEHTYANDSYMNYYTGWISPH